MPASAASDPDQKKRECTDISLHRSSLVVRRWATWYAVMRGERWPDVSDSRLTAHLLRRWVRKPVPHRVQPHEGLLPVLGCTEHLFRWSAHGFQVLFNEFAAEHGFPATHFGRKWTHRFLHELGMRYRKAQSAKVCDVSFDVLDRKERALLRKMVWLECTHEVATGMRFQSGRNGTDCTHALTDRLGEDQRRQGQDLISWIEICQHRSSLAEQLLAFILTLRSSDWCLYSHSESHWTSVTTLQEICHFMSDGVPGKKFIMLMYLCPVHCCRVTT